MRNAALVLAMMAILGILAARSCSERQATVRESAARAAAANATAQQRLLESQARRRKSSARSAAAGDAYYSPDAAGASTAQTEIHHCSYAGRTSSQLGPCQAPWVELSAPVQSTSAATAAASPSVLDQADWRLRVEQDKLAALTAQDRQSGQSGASHPSRCAQAKVARDAAYLEMGNDRNFAATRQWNDFVYEACKTH